MDTVLLLLTASLASNTFAAFSYYNAPIFGTPYTSYTNEPNEQYAGSYDGIPCGAWDSNNLGNCGVRQAVAVLTGADPMIQGVITFTQGSFEEPVVVQGKIQGLTPGHHGFHIHVTGDLSKGCDSTGSHFNPQSRQHGGPTSEDRHVGDLGNIEADANGEATVDFADSKISLFGDSNVLGRSLVVHEGEDDLGLGGYDDSLMSGHSGPRIACGVIGVL